MKWEYLLSPGPHPGDSISKFLNNLGEWGWELVQCDLAKNEYIFKRPKQEMAKSEKEIRQAIEGYVGGKIG